MDRLVRTFIRRAVGIVLLFCVADGFYVATGSVAYIIAGLVVTCPLVAWAGLSYIRSAQANARSSAPPNAG
jgi:hypothetical protein